MADQLTAIGPRSPAQVLRPGTSGQVVTTSGGTAVWADPTGGIATSSANNGKWLRTTSGAAVWASISSTDVSGLGGAALLNVGTAAATVAAGNDARFGTVPDHTLGVVKVDATGIASGQVIKALGDNTATWAADATGVSPGAITPANLSQDVLDRLATSPVTSVNGTTSGYWTTPDASVFDVTGTIDLRIKVQPTTWLVSAGQSLISKWNATGNQRSYRFMLNANSYGLFTFSTTGSNSLQALGSVGFSGNVPSGVPVWIRCLADPTGGAGGKALVTFYWSTDGTTWNQLDQVTSANAGPWFSGTGRVLLGMDDSGAGFQSPFQGDIYKAEIRDGSAVLIEDFNAGALTLTSTTLTATNGNVWTAGAGAAIRMVSSSASATVQSLLDIYDAKAYGQLSDLRRPSNCATTASSATITGTGFLSGNGDAGKLVMVYGAGATLRSASDGAMNRTSGDKNILDGTSFTRGMVGRYISVTGVGSAGATVTGRVWGYISSTQLRLSFNWTTSVGSGATYTISEDLYATITASASTTLTVDTTAGTSIASGEIWIGTDDSAAIQACITAAEGGSNAGNGYTVLLHGASAIGTGLRLTKPGQLLGSGGVGYSRTLGHGTTRLKPMKAGLVAVTWGGATTKMGVRGSMTASSGILTDPDAAFVSGDVGKAMYVMGAKTQSGSDSLDWLETTITSFQSATQVTLTAVAGTTVTETVYSYGAGMAVTFNGPQMKGVHIEGAAAQKCGLHVMNAGAWQIDNVAISDYYDGVGLLSDRGIGFNAGFIMKDFNIVDSFRGVVMFGSGGVSEGYGNIDGNSNVVDRCPPPGVVGLALNNTSLAIATQINCQAVEKWAIVDGSGRINAMGIRSECVPEGLVIGTDATNGNKGSRIKCQSWSNSSLGKQGKGIVLLSGVTQMTIDPGFYIQSDTDMWGQSDATALANTVRIEDQQLATTYTASNVTTDRTYDANSTTIDEVADVLGTLIADLRATGVVK